MGKPAARLTDMHTCPLPIHVGGPVITANPTVLIGGLPAATVGDMCTCIGPPDTIVQGSYSVLIGGRPAARMGDMTAHGGVIVAGCMTVLIGDTGLGLADLSLPAMRSVLNSVNSSRFAQMVALAKAAQNGSAFCDVCE